MPHNIRDGDFSRSAAGLLHGGPRRDIATHGIMARSFGVNAIGFMRFFQFLETWFKAYNDFL